MKITLLFFQINALLLLLHVYNRGSKFLSAAVQRTRSSAAVVLNRGNMDAV
jgi:hypothetical protein